VLQSGRGSLGGLTLCSVPQTENISAAASHRVGPGAAGDWLSLGRFALGLAVLVFAAFPQVLLGLQTFVVRDFGFFAFPLAHYQRECFWRAQLPLWNPYNNCGVPFLAQWNTMPLYPPALIYLLLPLEWSLSFFSLLHLFWAGLGMYCLARRWTGHRLAAAVAGLIFAFNGLSLNLLMWPSHMATLSWMPWVVLTVERAWEEGRRQLVLAALVGALQMLAGGPETILFTWLILLALWASRLWRVFRPPSVLPAESPAPSGPSSSFAALWRFPLVVVLVAALAAVQLLPFLDLAAHSQRDPGFADARWSMPAWGWMNFLVPMVYGSVWNKGLFFQYNQAWTSSYYLGVGGLLLALLGVWVAPQRRRTWLLAAAGTLGLALALGDQVGPVRWLRHRVPQLSLMTYPVKFVTVAVFAAPLLAAFGLARLQTLEAGQRREFQKRLVFLAALLLALIAGILLWAWRFPLPGDDVPATLRNGLNRAAFLVGAAVVLFALPRVGEGAVTLKPGRQRLGRLRPFVPVLLLLVLWLDVWTHEPPQNPSVPPWIYAPGLARAKLAMKPQPELGGSRAMVSPAAEVRFNQVIMSDVKNNFLVKRLGCFADCNLLDGVPKVNGFFSLYPAQSGELTSVLYGSTNASFPRLADFMGVSQITSPRDMTQWLPRDSFLPLATAGQRPIFLDDTNALRALIAPDFDSRKVVFLPPETKASVSVTNETSARVVSQRFMPERVDLEVEAAAPSLVVLAQTWYHPWRAYVGGAPARLLRANYAFQAVEVPAGARHLRLVYEDHALRAGAIISALALLACAAGGLASRRVRAGATRRRETLPLNPGRC